MEQHYLQIFLGVISALILFLCGIENLGKEFQSLAAEKFRTIIAKCANNRITGALFGAISTAVIQSSSAVTVVVVILVNTGIISFKQSLGIMFGTNVGTTVTAQLALLHSSLLAPTLIIVGFFLNLLSPRFRIISKPIFFLGFILFALSLLSTNLTPLKENPDVMLFFATLSSPILAYIASALFTMLVQSSTVTSGMVVILVQSGMIPVEVGIPMILGANLGSSTTAFIASLRLNVHAKRAGVAKFVFNLIGTGFFMIFLTPFTMLIQSFSVSPGAQAALAHLLFNLMNTTIFLTLLTPFEKFILWLVKGEEKEILFETKYLSKDEKISFDRQIINIKKEIAYSIEITIKIYQQAISMFYNPNKIVEMEIHKLETLNDFLDDEITTSIVSLTKKKLSQKNAQQTIALVKVSNTVEQIGDLGKDFSEVFKNMHKLNKAKSEVDIEALTDIHNKLIELFRKLEIAIKNPTKREFSKLKVLEDDMGKKIKEYFDVHVKKLEQEDNYQGSVFVDGISIIELSVSKAREIRKVFVLDK
jgi:phosphate:Na+ symporter